MKEYIEFASYPYLKSVAVLFHLSGFGLSDISSDLVVYLIRGRRRQG